MHALTAVERREFACPNDDVPNDCRYVFTYVPEPLVRATLSRSACLGVKESKKFISLTFLAAASLRFRFGSEIWFIQRLKHWSRCVSFRFAHHSVKQHFPFRVYSFLAFCCHRSSWLLDAETLSKFDFIARFPSSQNITTTARHSRHSPNDWRSLSSGRPVQIQPSISTANIFFSVYISQIFTLYRSGPNPEV